MHRNCYSEEIGLDAGERIVPRTHAALLLGALAIGAWFATAALQTEIQRRHEAERIAATAASPVRTGLARK